MVCGKQERFRTPLNKNKVGRVRESTIPNELKYLMMAVAVEDAGKLEIISDKNAYFTICEEYAKTGLEYLERTFIESLDILDTLEFEALEFYDDYIEKSED